MEAGVVPGSEWRARSGARGRGRLGGSGKGDEGRGGAGRGDVEGVSKRAQMGRLPWSGVGWGWPCWPPLMGGWAPKTGGRGRKVGVLLPRFPCLPPSRRRSDRTIPTQSTEGRGEGGRGKGKGEGPIKQPRL